MIFEILERLTEIKSYLFSKTTNTPISVNKRLNLYFAKYRARDTDNKEAIWQKLILEDIVQKCARCILPTNYPGIYHNDQGVCNFCTSHETKEYLGDENLKKKVSAILVKHSNRNKSYDCVVGISGGRDSSYILWYAVKKLGLNVIAYSADHGFVPDTAIENMKNISHNIGAELVIEKSSYLKKCLQHHLKAFTHRPSAAGIGLLCTGCKLGIDMGLLRFARNNKIPLVISGGSPLEVGSYKTGLLRTNPKNKSIMTFFMGYLKLIRRNPKWIAKPAAGMVQFQEFYHHYANKTLKKKVSVLSPFYRYIEWNEKEIVGTLRDEIGWQYDTKKNTSTWKVDCYLAPIRKYLYKKFLGFNDLDDHLSALIRAGQITRQEATSRLDKESSVPEHVLSDICEKLGINKYRMDNILLKRSHPTH